MADKSTDVIRRYLEEAIAAEQSLETQLRGFAQQGDDDEVQAAFLAHAEETRVHAQQLVSRLEALGGSASAGKNFLARLFSFTAKTAQLGHSPGEELLGNLIAAFTAAQSECAMYEALANVADAAGDPETEAVAREIQSHERATAEKLWHFIPARSKIAFNLLTAGEIDPAIETKAPDDRVI